MLFELPASDIQTLSQICDDTLVGITAINPRKFAEEFSRQRKSGTINVERKQERLTSDKGDLSAFDSGNRFTAVNGKKKKKGKK